MKELVDSTEKKSYTVPERANRAALLERLAILYRSNEQYQQAVRVFRQIAELDPDMGPRVAAQVVDTLRQAKDYTRAVEESDAAVQQVSQRPHGGPDAGFRPGGGRQVRAGRRGIEEALERGHRQGDLARLGAGLREDQELPRNGFDPGRRREAFCVG